MKDKGGVRKVRTVLSLLLVFIFTIIACLKHTYITGKGAGIGDKKVYSKWHSHWLFALVGDEVVDIKKICPSGNALVKNEISFINGLIGAFVGAIYYPTTVEVYCAESKVSSTIELSPEDVRKITMSPEFVEVVDEVEPSRVDEVIAAQMNEK